MTATLWERENLRWRGADPECLPKRRWHGGIRDLSIEHGNWKKL